MKSTLNNQINFNSPEPCPSGTTLSLWMHEFSSFPTNHLKNLRYNSTLLKSTSIRLYSTTLLIHKGKSATLFFSLYLDFVRMLQTADF